MGKGRAPNNSNIDRLIGHRVKELRRQHYKRVQVLADLINMEHQHYQKAEAGVRRFSSHELASIAQELDIKIEQLFPEAVLLPTPPADISERHASDAEMHDLLHYFSGVENPVDRQFILQLVKASSNFKK